jgi:hypothetical protein
METLGYERRHGGSDTVLNKQSKVITSDAECEGNGDNQNSSVRLGNHDEMSSLANTRNQHPPRDNSGVAYDKQKILDSRRPDMDADLQQRVPDSQATHVPPPSIIKQRPAEHKMEIVSRTTPAASPSITKNLPVELGPTDLWGHDPGHKTSLDFAHRQGTVGTISANQRAETDRVHLERSGAVTTLAIAANRPVERASNGHRNGPSLRQNIISSTGHTTTTSGGTSNLQSVQLKGQSLPYDRQIDDGEMPYDAQGQFMEMDQETAWDKQVHRKVRRNGGSSDATPGSVQI